MNMSMATPARVATPQTATAVDKSLLCAIKAELALFNSTGVRGQFLEKVYTYLITIPPTSVEAERAFSAAGSLCTKVRSRLGDGVLDTLCFLRSFYTANATGVGGRSAASAGSSI